MKSQLAIEELREFLGEIQNAESETLGEMLESAKKMLTRQKDEAHKEEIRRIIQKIEGVYIPLRKYEILFEPEYY